MSDFYLKLSSFELLFRLSRLLHKHMFEEAEKFAITFELDLEASISQVALLATVTFCSAFTFELRVFIVLHSLISSSNCC